MTPGPPPNLTPPADCRQSGSPSSPTDEVTAWQRVIDAAQDRGNELPPSSSSSPSAPYSLDTQESSVKNPPPAVVPGQVLTDFWARQGELNQPKSADEPECGPELCEDQAFRHGGWENIRRRVRKSLFDTNQPAHRVAAFDNCGSSAWIEVNEETGAFRMKVNRCRDRLCTPCANERSWRLKAALQAVMKDKPHSFITLTLAGGEDDLKTRIDRLYKGFRALRLHPLWQGKVRGGAAFLEIKYSDKAGRWHPHLHIIADADYIEVGLLSNAWRSITGDSFICDVRRVKDTPGSARYVTKYASKPLNTSFAFNPVLLNEAVEALKGRRLCLTFGTWYGTPLDLVDEEELDNDTASLYNWTTLGTLAAVHARAAQGEERCLAALRAVHAYRHLANGGSPSGP
jgi:Replication protein